VKALLHSLLGTQLDSSAFADTASIALRCSASIEERASHWLILHSVGFLMKCTNSLLSAHLHCIPTLDYAADWPEAL
jgi:hypothetical protein